jgi:uncharacterized membrane protein
MKGKTLSMVAIFLFGILAIAGVASALPTIDYVRINDEKYESGDKLVVELGEDIEIKIKLQADTGNESDVEIEADILGYEYNDYNEISDSTATFDMDQDDTEFKTLNVQIPHNADKDEYDLRIRVAGRTGTAFEGLYRLKVDGARHSIVIKDVVLSPENDVKAGRALLGTLRIENYGETDEDELKVKISIPALGLSASDYIDELEEDDSTTSEELYLRIPSCTEAGTYTVVAEVEYDEGYETVRKETTIRVTDGDTCETATSGDDDTDDKPAQSQAIISVGSTKQDVPKGEGGVVYPLTITNAGRTSKTFVLTVDGVDSWATTRMSPANTVVLGAGEMKAVYLYLTANEDAAAGEKMFTVSVSSDGTVMKQIPFTANVVEGDNTASSDWGRLRNGLLTGLAIIVVLLVLLGLIIGFNKLKGSDEDDDDLDDEGKTYY